MFMIRIKEVIFGASEHFVFIGMIAEYKRGTTPLLNIFTVKYLILMVL